MQVMNWAHPFDHRAAEANMTAESGPVNDAIRSAREYAMLFVWMRDMPMSMGRLYLTDIAWGLFGQMLYIDAVTR
jgi:hypothetical protein